MERNEFGKAKTIEKNHMRLKAFAKDKNEENYLLFFPFSLSLSPHTVKLTTQINDKVAKSRAHCRKHFKQSIDHIGFIRHGEKLTCDFFGENDANTE